MVQWYTYLCKKHTEMSLLMWSVLSALSGLLGGTGAIPLSWVSPVTPTSYYRSR